LGIVAHVDAGKTTLTERLLHAAGAIDAIGSVDAGTTQTDYLALERERGITIRAAVVSFVLGDSTVNLIDTPGHPDFIAEVDRSLRVLDGAVLIVSAVEGVQPQTIVLTRALRRLRVPTLIFVNKIDRTGAAPSSVLHEIAERLGIELVAMGGVHDAGSRSASFVPDRFEDEESLHELAAVLAERDDELLETLVEEPGLLDAAELRSRLANQTARGWVHPVFFGSATTGAGIDELITGITQLLPSADLDAAAPASGSVFKIERGAEGEKIAYVRVFRGTIRIRDRIHIDSRAADRVAGIRAFEQGSTIARPTVGAGQIAQLFGLRHVRVGDRIGDETAEQGSVGLFAPPTLETVVVPVDPSQKASLHAALAQLAEQDPLINLRQDDSRDELQLSLFGEVQKEVIQQTLARDFGIDVTFRESTTIYIERPLGSGYAVEYLQDDENPYPATVGLRVDPGPISSGVEFRLEISPRAVPIYIYKNEQKFRAAMSGYVNRRLEAGLFGWQVTDCIVTLEQCTYYTGDGPRKPTRPTPRTSASHFRKLTPIVLLAALTNARTSVCEPVLRFHLEAPVDTLDEVLRLVARHRGVPEPATATTSWLTLEGEMPAAEVHGMQQELRGRTHGHGSLELSFDHYEPVTGAPPTRRRANDNR
jgi:ribosomal protection tetracycline resistance protein